MTILNSIIPTFQPGQRVRIQPRAPEYPCPDCGSMRAWYGEVPEWDAEIIGLEPPGTRGITQCCGALRPAPEGFYSVTHPDAGEVSVPWTWVTPIDGAADGGQ